MLYRPGVHSPGLFCCSQKDNNLNLNQLKDNMGNLGKGGSGVFPIDIHLHIQILFFPLFMSVFCFTSNI